MFGIAPSLLNALLWAHVRYEDLIGVTEVGFLAFRAEERAVYLQWFNGECMYSMEDAISFMPLACRLPVTQAIAWVCRAKIQQVRSGLIDNAVEPADWTYASVTGCTQF